MLLGFKIKAFNKNSIRTFRVFSASGFKNSIKKKTKIINTYGKCHEDLCMHFGCDFVCWFFHEKLKILFKLLSSLFHLLNCLYFISLQNLICFSCVLFFLSDDLSLSANFEKLFEILAFHRSFILLCGTCTSCARGFDLEKNTTKT